VDQIPVRHYRLRLDPAGFGLSHVSDSPHFSHAVQKLRCRM
jgi:hypothetical protein